MPCGGISPIQASIVADVARDTDYKNLECWHCGKPGARHFVEEWDAFIHGHCVPAFLETEEGQVIVEHGHRIYVDTSLEL